MDRQASRPLPVLDIVVPCFNEEATLPKSADRLRAKLLELIESQQITRNSAIVYVDDGSVDQTWPLIESFCREDVYTRGIKLSRNRGHQNALLAGLLSSQADLTISIDADLQDDVDAIDEMLAAYRQGAEIVYGVRADRSSDTLFKRFSARLFYKTMSLFGVEAIHNHADFRLMSRKVLNGLASFREVNLYLRGIIPLIGYNHATVEYVRCPRLQGESKYPLRKMLALALDGITSFSVVPLNVIFYFSFIVIFMVLGLVVWAFWEAFIAKTTVPGWTSTVLAILFMGGVQILCLGVLGNYLGRIYAEVKSRPRFFIDKVAPNNDSTDNKKFDN
ncbi:MAG TPA: glycosyltransferase family 2 protein [Gammaproteobacteria bacterium]|nr:glycosyltransferase family 2 protein [Gammaproteobacteria bacterium]